LQLQSQRATRHVGQQEHHLLLTRSQGNRSDLCLQLRDIMRACGVSVTPLAHAALLPTLEASDAIALARDLEASEE